MHRVFVVLVFVLTWSISAASSPEAILVVVGDQHSAYERTAQFVAHVDRIKAENPGVPLAVLINGDSFELGNAVAQRSGGAVEFAMFTALARRAPTVLNLGNHEPEFYDPATTVERIRATGVTVIGNLAHATSRQLFAPASTRLTLGSQEMVIAGITIDVLSQYRAAVRKLLDLTNPRVWAGRHFPTLLAQAPVAIVLSHAGLRNDREILPLVPPGTLYLGAHDHTRYVHREDRTTYVQSGAWNSHFSVVRLRSEDDGTSVVWDVEQVAIAADDPADAELAVVVRDTLARHLTAEDTAVVGQADVPRARTEAARFVVAAVRDAAGVDAAFLGNTTFGDGLPAGPVTRMALNACVRFDGAICVAEISGEELARWMAAANQGPETPFAQRKGEFLFAVGPDRIVPHEKYRVATNDWGARNRERYFGRADLEFTEKPELRLKAIVAEALKAP